jgi:hypothetical protein
MGYEIQVSGSYIGPQLLLGIRDSNLIASNGSLGSIGSRLDGIPHVFGLPCGIATRVAQSQVSDDPKSNGGNCQNEREYNQGQRKDGHRIIRRPLPEGFFWLVLAAAGLGSLVGSLLGCP